MMLKVIIADDHLLFRQGLLALLRQEPDMEVVAEAGDGAAALRLATELIPDVVLMDISMPDMNGIEATRQIMAVLPEVHVLILSMEFDRSIVLESLDAGAIGYLLKDCAVDELAAAIRYAAAGETYLSPKISNLVIREFFHRNSLSECRSDGRLTERERSVLQQIADGRNTKEIAFAFGVSLKTIDSQRHSIMKKLGLYSIAELTKYAVRTGLSSL